MTKSHGPPPMDTQPSDYRQDWQAVPVAQSTAKKGKRKIRFAQPGVPPHQAERARKASLNKQREQLTMQAGARSVTSILARLNRTGHDVVSKPFS